MENLNGGGVVIKKGKRSKTRRKKQKQKNWKKLESHKQKMAAPRTRQLERRRQTHVRVLK